jgi:hypothetical protein
MHSLRRARWAGAKPTDFIFPSVTLAFNGEETFRDRDDKVQFASLQALSVFLWDYHRAFQSIVYSELAKCIEN